MLRFRDLLLSLLVGGLTAGMATGEDWPEFRGAGAQGHSNEVNLPTTWSETENVRWKADVPGQGWSSPVIVGNRIFLTTAVLADEAAEKSDRSLRTLCYDLETGSPVWDTEVFLEDGDTTPGIHQKNSHASPTPIVSAERIYVHFGHEGTACLDLDGNILWRTNELRYPPMHGNGASPVLFEDRLIFPCDGAEKPFVAAISTLNGEVLWKHERGVEAEKKFSFCTPLHIKVNGVDQVIVPGANIVNAFAPTSSEPIWSARYTGYSVVPRPLYSHNLVIFSTGYDKPQLLAIRPDGLGDVTDSHIAWHYDKNAPNTPSMVIVGDELYMVSDNGVATCLDVATGESHWQKRLGGNFSSSLLFADGKIYFQDELGKATVIAPGKEFTQLAVNNLNERTLASYATAAGALFIRTDGHLYRIQKQP